MGLGYWQSHPMREKPSPREVLSANLKALMAADPDRVGTIKRVAAASGTALSNGKVGRIYAASHTTDIDTLQHLAAVFGLEPWQLLVEGLRADALPRLADASVLAQILDAVETTGRKGSSPSNAHQLKQRSEPEVGPALKQAMNRVRGKNERSKDDGVQKPRTRRRV
jgi:hypothetical protein